MPNLNALRHGCCAVETILLPHEKQEDFESLKKEYQDTYENLGEFEQDLLNHAILSEWLHIRATKSYLETEFALYTETPSQANWTDDQHTKLNRALRYKTKHANDVRAHLKHLESFKRARRAEVKEAATIAVKKQTVELKLEQQKTEQMKLERGLRGRL
jgi:DUF438 domain-containing protein